MGKKLRGHPLHALRKLIPANLWSPRANYGEHDILRMRLIFEKLKSYGQEDSMKTRVILKLGRPTLQAT